MLCCTEVNGSSKGKSPRLACGKVGLGGTDLQKSLRHILM